MSTSSGAPTPLEVKTILNVILREMFRRADLVDLYSLADPERCSKYVVVSAKLLTKLFASINLEPVKGPDGIIYFQKVEGIQKANPLGAEQDVLCKFLAFFFIRIFRIYAALTLSIIDSEVPQVDPVLQGPAVPFDKRGVVVINPSAIPGFTKQQAPVKRGWWQGGSLAQGPSPTGSGDFYLDPNRADIYKILNLFLVAPNDRTDRTVEMRMKDFDITFQQDVLYDFDAANNRITKNFIDKSVPTPIILYTFKNNDKYRNMRAKLVLSRNRDSNMEVTLEDVQRIEVPSEKRTVTGILLNRRPGDENPMSDSGKNLPGVIQEMFLKVFDAFEPPVFSAVEFLKKYNIITNLYGNVKIEQTTLIIPDPKSYITKGRVPIQYIGRAKIDNSSREIKISAQMYIHKKDKLVNTPQEYIVGVDLTSVTTTPETLKDLLTMKRERFRAFYTGEADNTTPLSERGETVAAFLQSVFEDLLKGINEDGLRGGISYDNQGRPKPYDSDKIPEAFKVKKLWESIAKDKPIKSHCVARAIQLLNVAAIRDPSTTEAYSNVCRIKFPYITDGSLPQPGKSILTEDGIYAMAMLFVDGLLHGTAIPKITDTKEFKEFRRRLKFSFERYRDITNVQNAAVPTRLDEVSEKLMPFCEGHTDDRIKVKDALLDTLRTKANELIRRQVIHTARVMQLLFKLFNERSVRAGTFEINDTIMQGGMEAINLLAEEARNLLIEYYSDCESKYREGLFAIYDEDNRDPKSLEYAVTNS